MMLKGISRTRATCLGLHHYFHSEEEQVGYLERAQLIGHDVSRLKNGETIQSIMLVDTLDKFKAIFAAASTPEQRAEFSRQIWALPAGAQVGRFPDVAMTRLMSHVFGDGDLSAADAEFANKVFPLKINAVSGQTVTVSTAIVYGPSGAPTVVNAGTLIFAGGSITAENTVLTVAADTLEIQASQTTTNPYHIGILGATPPTAGTGSTGSSTSGQAPPGTSAQPRSPGICEGSPGGGTGSTGAPGGPGGPGDPGAPGLPSLNAQISASAYGSPPASFVIFTQSGGGGQGGQGGPGGQGQQGGNGGDGCNSGCEGTHGGNGGTGGAGGQGGTGGPGGPGSNGLTITISFPASAKAYLVANNQNAPGGAGGALGVGGAPGAGGGAGTAGKWSSGGVVGAAGAVGIPGGTGTASTITGAPSGYTYNWT